MLFLLFLFLFVYLHLITRKKKNVIQFWDFMMNEFEFSWSQKYSNITLFPTLLCVSPLAQTPQMPLLYEILIVTGRLQPPHLFFIYLFIYFYKFSIVLSLQINQYVLQWDIFLSIFPILLVMTQVHLPKPNHMSATDKEWL